jgi:hypothetical protein
MKHHHDNGKIEGILRKRDSLKEDPHPKINLETLKSVPREV